MMPAMLIVACIISAVVEDWLDVGIIGTMILLNAMIGCGYLNFVPTSVLPYSPHPHDAGTTRK